MKLRPVERAKLREFLEHHFSLDELKTLAFDLGVAYESLPHQTTQELAREMIAYSKRTDGLEYLVTEALTRRPDHELSRLFAELMTQPHRAVSPINFEPGTQRSTQVIYDATRGIDIHDVSGRMDIKDGILISTGGYYELQKYLYDQQCFNYLPKNEVLAGRKLRIGFEAKVTQGKFIVHFIFKALARDERLATKEIIIDGIEWEKYDLCFRFSSAEDCILKFAFEPRVNGSIQMRNLVLAEDPS